MSKKTKAPEPVAWQLLHEQVTHSCGHTKDYEYWPPRDEAGSLLWDAEWRRKATEPCLDCQGPEYWAQKDREEEGEALDDTPLEEPCWTGCGTFVPVDSPGYLPVFCSDACKESYVRLSDEEMQRMRKHPLQTMVLSDELSYVLEINKAHLSAFVPLEIERLRRQGGPTDGDIERVQETLRSVMNKGAGHATMFLDPGQSAYEMGLLTIMLAVAAFVPGGIHYDTLYFDAARAITRTGKPGFMDRVVAALDADPRLDAHRAWIDAGADDGSKHPDEVSAEEYLRVIALETELCNASLAGDHARAALLEVEIDTILLRPQPVEQKQALQMVAQLVPIDTSALVQVSLWESA